MSTLFHLHTKTHSRSTGKSAIATAAYRAGEKLFDQGSGETFDYRQKSDVEHCEILVPEDAPEWATDRQSLWQGVEISEKRKDSQLAREVEVAFPRQFSEAQCLKIIREFAHQQFVEWGMIADVAIHRKPTKAPENSADQWERHAHILLTMREITPGGFGPKVRYWNKHDHVQTWRKAWQEVVNRELAMSGFDERIDHRSLAAQREEALEKGEVWRAKALDRQPETKIGPVAKHGRRSKLKSNPRLARWERTRLRNKQHFRELERQARDSDQPVQALAQIRSSSPKKTSNSRTFRPKAMARPMKLRTADLQFETGINEAHRTKNDKEIDE